MITLKTTNYTAEELKALHELISEPSLETHIPCNQNGCKTCKYYRLCTDWCSIYRYSAELAKVPFDI